MIRLLKTLGPALITIIFWMIGLEFIAYFFLFTLMIALTLLWVRSEEIIDYYEEVDAYRRTVIEEKYRGASISPALDNIKAGARSARS